MTTSEHDDEGQKILTPSVLTETVMVALTTNDPILSAVPMIKALAVKTVRALSRAKRLLQDADAHLTKPDESWIFKWQLSLMSSDDEVEDYFSHLLVREVTRPGSFSKRTITTLADLTSQEAVAFQFLCSHIFHYATMPVLLCAQAKDLNLEGLAHAGLVDTKERRGNSQDCVYIFHPPDNADMGSIALYYFDQSCTFADASKAIPVPTVKLTIAGRELYHISKARPIKGLWEQGVQKMKDAGAEILPEREHQFNQAYHGLIKEAPQYVLDELKAYTKAKGKGVQRILQIVSLVNHRLKNHPKDPRCSLLISSVLLDAERGDEQADRDKLAIVNALDEGIVRQVNFDAKKGRLSVSTVRKKKEAARGLEL